MEDERRTGEERQAEEGESRGLTRREFLIGLGIAAAGGILSLWESLWRASDGTTAKGLSLTPRSYLPYVAKDQQPPTPTPSPTSTPLPPPSKPRVVRVHDAQATNWAPSSSSGWYGDYVDLGRVETMLLQGLMALTGTSTASDAWSQLLPAYSSGQIIAVKISLNNSTSCDDNDNQIDAIPQTLIALVKTLTEDRGVAQSDIWFYDTTKRNNRNIPTRLSGPVWDRYPDVHFVGKGECGATEIAYDEADDDLRIDLNDPDGNLQPRYLTPLLKSATYLINIPLFKYHGIHPVSVGFKNHFGSINYVLGGGADNIHPYIDPDNGAYRSNYSPLVEIYDHPYIREKTILTIGDALFGAYGATQAPTRWSTFGDASPNSLFLARDPVALDCVMIDFIRAEWPTAAKIDHAYDYLFVAQDRGLGVCEGTFSNPGGDPWHGEYDDIDYRLIEL